LDTLTVTSIALAILVGLPFTILLVAAASAKSKIRDSWTEPKFDRVALDPALPEFVQPQIAERNPLESLDVFLESWLSYTERSLGDFSNSRRIRQMAVNKQTREANLLFYEYAEELAAELNSRVQDRIIRYFETGILADTVSDDDFVPLGTLKVPSMPLPFASDLSEPFEDPGILESPSKPTLEGTELPRVIELLPRSLREKVRADFLKKRIEVWNTQLSRLGKRQEIVTTAFSNAELDRQERLKDQQIQYAEAEALYVQAAKTHNLKIEMILQGLDVGEKKAVEEYALMVLGRGIYADEVQPSFTVLYNEVDQELEITLRAPEAELIQELMPHYKLVKSSKSLVNKGINKTESKRLYSSVVMQLMIRAAHEVCESDRAGSLKSVSITGVLPDKISGTEVAIAQLAGTPDEFSADRLRGDTASLFLSLGGAISKDPIEVVPLALKGNIRGKK
tara:strand:- start:1220 stop:2575 length:1356 start_codon:yes stop_codon:yes gene_type:complete